MNPIIITYVGFFVAALILAWAVFEMSRRFYRHRKVDVKAMSTWVPLQPASHALSSPEEEGEEEKPRQNHHSRSQQNGHYSESKKN